jgi:pimeloyl-ACP methyl ester carboxylesterase
MWTAETDYLKSHFTVLRYDLRAHGQSTVPASPFSHVDDLFQLLDELHLRQVALVGLSAGSTIALDAALQAPDRISRMVLVAPAISGFSPAAEPPAFVGPLVAALRDRDYAKAADVMLDSPLFQVPDQSRALVHSMVTENDRLWTVPIELMKGPGRPAAGRLEEVRIPTLVLVGERDLAVQREQADALARRIAGARLVIVPEGGHMLNLTSPAAFRDAVMQFLTPVEDPDRRGRLRHQHEPS